MSDHGSEPVAQGAERSEPVAQGAERSEPAAQGAERSEPVAQGAGRVVLVATPIGNLADLSPRAAETLAGADIICCEDTRRTRKLLSHAGITGARLVAVHEHNEASAAERAISEAAAGAVVAVVSDAGLPGISDPGERLVRAALAAGVAVSVVPGPSAGVAALVASGLSTERFCFEGFLPRKGGERATRVAAIAAEPRTTVVYEAPHRVARTLNDLRAACGGGRRVAVARELTKVHEEWWRGSLDGAVAWVDGGQPRGEWVLVIDGAAGAGTPATDGDVRAAVADRLAAGDDQRAAVASVAAALGVPRRRAYQAAVELRSPERAGRG